MPDNLVFGQLGVNKVVLLELKGEFNLWVSGLVRDGKVPQCEKRFIRLLLAAGQIFTIEGVVSGALGEGASICSKSVQFLARVLVIGASTVVSSHWRLEGSALESHSMGTLNFCELVDVMCKHSLGHVFR
jgi:hypothetical protein